MIVALIIGLMVGFVIAIPPGPIGLAAIRTGIRDGWVPSLKLALGAGLFDILYGALAMAATSAIVVALNDLVNSSPIAYLLLQVAIVALMIVFGVNQMRQKPVEPNNLVGPTKKPSSFMEWVKGHGPFFVGVGFAIANLANPTFIPALAAMATFIQQMQLFEHSFFNNTVFAVGFGIGNMLWLSTLARLVIRNRHRLTPTFVKRIQQISGATLIGFGAFYGIRILVITEWSDVIQIAFVS